MKNAKHQSFAVKMSKHVSEDIELEKIDKNQERIGPETTFDNVCRVSHKKLYLVLEGRSTPKF